MASKKSVNAENLAALGAQRLAAILMQGSRMSLGCDDLEHVAVVPSSLLAPATEAGLGAPVPGAQVEGDLAKQSEVARSRPVAHPAVILPEGNVQHPMQRVLNAPMSADCPDQDAGSSLQLVRK